MKLPPASTTIQRVLKNTETFRITSTLICFCVFMFVAAKYELAVADQIRIPFSPLMCGPISFLVLWGREAFKNMRKTGTGLKSLDFILSALLDQHSKWPHVRLTFCLNRERLCNLDLFKASNNKPCVIFVFEMYYMTREVPCLIIGFDKNQPLHGSKFKVHINTWRPIHCHVT